MKQSITSRHCMLYLRLLLAGLLLLPLHAAVALEVLVEYGSDNKYLVNTSDPGISPVEDWTEEIYPDESNWSDGSYGIGYEAGSGSSALNLLKTVIPSGTSGNRPLTIYTRTTFAITDITTVNNVFLGADYDDGYAAWINGVEVFRSSQLPSSGSLDWDTTPGSHESSNALTPNYGTLVDITATALPELHNGTNVLAIGAWNRSNTSSDHVLVPRLSINEPIQVTRGPYLQTGTPTSVIVKWSTLTPTNSQVQYGSAPGSLTNSVSSGVSGLDHEITLTGLSPDTTYYYSVGSTTEVLAGNDADHFFLTAPPTGTSKPTRIWVLGDSGTANTNARNVRDAYNIFTGSTHTDLWMMLGDNAYNDGYDAEYQAAVFDTYPEMLRKSVLWPTLGNHDGHQADSASQSGPYYDIFTLPKSGEAGGLSSGTEAYYSFDYGNIHFICLESYETNRSSGGAMLTWAAADIAATTQEWVIAFWHHPPYSKGSHDSDNNNETSMIEMRENALPILEAAGVDLVLSGHSHSYERSFLLEGHYDTSDTLDPVMEIDNGNGRECDDGAYKAVYDAANPYQGTVYITAGSSGKVSSGKPLDHPVMIHASIEALGSLVLDVDGNRLDATFLRDNGSIEDTFTILKTPDNAPPQLDTDNDGVVDICDNCTLTDNPGQQDPDGDGHGTACDADFNQDCIVNGLDIGPFKAQFFGVNPEFDLNNDGVVNGLDIVPFKDLFFLEPGPSPAGSLCNP